MLSATNLKDNFLFSVFHFHIFSFFFFFFCSPGDLNLKCQNLLVCLFFNPGISNQWLRLFFVLWDNCVVRGGSTGWSSSLFDLL
jgi:hypothetical protein